MRYVATQRLRASGVVMHRAANLHPLINRSVFSLGFPVVLVPVLVGIIVGSVPSLMISLGRQLESA